MRGYQVPNGKLRSVPATMLYKQNRLENDACTRMATLWNPRYGLSLRLARFNRYTGKWKEQKESAHFAVDPRLL